MEHMFGRRNENRQDILRTVSIMIGPLLVSLRVLTLALPVIILLGGWIGWILARKAFPGKMPLSLLIQLPLILPPSVTGFYLLLLFGKTPFLRHIGALFSFPALVISASVPAIPIMAQAARTLGKG